MPLRSPGTPPSVTSTGVTSLPAGQCSGTNSVNIVSCKFPHSRPSVPVALLPGSRVHPPAGVYQVILHDRCLHRSRASERAAARRGLLNRFSDLSDKFRIHRDRLAGAPTQLLSMYRYVRANRATPDIHGSMNNGRGINWPLDCKLCFHKSIS